MSKLNKFLVYWLPLIIWMCAIFTGSADVDSVRHSSTLFEPFIRWLFPHMAAERVEEIHHLFRKVCHMLEYGVFAVLAWRAVRQPKRNDRRPWRWDEAGLALAILLLYAATDELHQVYVPGRTGQFSDVMVDIVGGSITLGLLWLTGKIFKRW